MITCELCPRAFHSKCLGIVPASEDWVCPECEVSLSTMTFIESHLGFHIVVLLQFNIKANEGR